MITGKKSIIIFLVCAAACVIFLGLLALLAPRISQSRAIQKTVTRELSRLLQTDVAIEGLSLETSGAPRLVLQGLSCAAGGSIPVHIKKITITPDLQALLAGALKAEHIYVESPAVTIRLDEGKKLQAGGPQKLEAGEALAAIMRSMPSGSCIIEKGLLRLIAPDGTQLDFSSIGTKLTTAQNSISLFSECASELWEKLELKADCRPRADGSSSADLSLEVSITSVNAVACKKMAPAFAAQQQPLETLCRAIQEGRIPRLTLAANLAFPLDESWSKQISLQGSVEAMHISIPEAGLDVHELSGEINFSSGMVEAKGLQARIGSSRISNGALRLDSADHFLPALITAEISADLADLPLLLRLIPSPGVRAELGLIKNPSGLAGCTITVRKEAAGYSTEVSLRELNLNASYRSFPIPLALQRGTCISREGTLTLKDFSGRLGASALPEISVSFGIMDDDRFSVSVKNAAVALDDLYAVLKSFDATKAFMAPVTKASGSALIQDIAISGPLSSPRDWAFSMHGSLSSASFFASELDGPVLIAGGSIALDQTRAALTRGKIKFLDAALSGSLILNSSLAGIQKVSGEAAGSFGNKSMALAAAYLKVPGDLLLRAPLSFEKAKFSWNQAGETAFAGELFFPGETQVSIDVTSKQGSLEIRSLKIKDAESQCIASLGLRDDLFNISYRGTLGRATLDRIFADNRFLQGEIAGDFTAAFNEKTPLASLATGNLTWENAGYAGFKGFPVTINSASVNATGRDLVIERASVTRGKSSADIAGSVRFDESGFNLDIDVSSDSIDLDADKIPQPGGTMVAENDNEELWDTPLRGTVRLRARELKKNALLWSPFDADIMFFDRKIIATAADVQLCGIALPGTMQITPDRITLEAHPEASGISVKEALQCLTGERSIITGTLDIKSDIAGQGKAADLLAAVAGDITIKAQNGRIYKANLLTKILSFLSIRNLLYGGRSDFAHKGFSYRLLEIHGEVQGDTFFIRDAILDSDSLTIACKGSINLKDKTLDLTALATPFQVQDLVLMAVPVIRTVFNKTFIGVPIKISGTIENTKLSSGLPAAIGKGLADAVKKIVKYPVKIIEPVLLYESERGSKQAP